MEKENIYDVIIIGGSYAGLSAAMALGRSLRNIIIIDNGIPCNKQSPHSHNFLTQDGKTPTKISNIARQQVAKYHTVKFHQGKALKGAKNKNGFQVEMESGQKLEAKKLIFATGIKDQMPDIKGFSACWGISVVHCPYCHGYEIKNEVTGILSNGDIAVHYASLISNLTKSLTIFTNGKSTIAPEKIRELESHHISIIETEIDSIAHKNGQMENLVFKNGSSAALKALYANVPFKQHTDIPEGLGCELTEQGFLSVNPFQQTSIEGVFACGDNSSMMRSIANAVASGNLAGAAVNKELCEEQF